MQNGTGSAAGGQGVHPPDGPEVPPLRPAVPAPPGSSPLEPSDPVRIGDYDLVATLGIGGMGTVYLGRSPDGTRVAVKVVHSHLAADAEFRSRFATEIQAARRVPPFCTAPVRGSGSHLGRPYLITDYIEGVPLSRLVTDDGPLDPATLHGVAVGAAAALTAIHGSGVVHRDLKPSNVLIALGGVRIIDFGIARSLDIAHSHTGTGVILGSLGWASPEQLNAAPATPAMDIFGWGCLVAFAATGRHPFGGEEAATRAWRILNGDPALDAVPDSVRDLVEAALRRDPSHRPTARQLLLALTQASSTGADETASTVPPRAARQSVPGRRVRRDAAVAAAVIPLAVALVFGVVKATTGALPIMVDPVREDSPAIVTSASGEPVIDDPAAVSGPTSTTSARPTGPGAVSTRGAVTTSPGIVVTTSARPATTAAVVTPSATPTRTASGSSSVPSSPQSSESPATTAP